MLPFEDMRGIPFVYSVPRIGQSTVSKLHQTSVVPSTFVGKDPTSTVNVASGLSLFAACASLAVLRKKRLRQAHACGRGPARMRIKKSVTMYAGSSLVLDEHKSLSTVSLALMGAALYMSNLATHQLTRQALVTFSGQPFSACTLIFATGALYSFVAWGFGWQDSPGCPLYYDKSDIKLLLSTMVMHGLTFLLTLSTARQLNFAASPIPPPLWAALASLSVLNMVPYFSVLGSLALIVAGLGALSMNGMTFGQTGNIFAIGASVAWVLKMALARGLLNSGKVDGMNLFSLISLVALLISLPVKLLWEGTSFPAITALLR